MSVKQLVQEQRPQPARVTGEVHGSDQAGGVLMFIFILFYYFFNDNTAIRMFLHSCTKNNVSDALSMQPFVFSLLFMLV